MKRAGRKKTLGIPKANPMFLKSEHAEEPYLTIGKVARIAGASAKAIRHYEALGLLPSPARRGKYRIYSERDVFLVHVLKFCQRLGFHLEELRDLVAGNVSHKRFPLDLANQLFDRKREELRAQILEVRETLELLEAVRKEMNRHFRA